MTSDWLSADDIITMINLMVLKMGADAFPHNGRGHLYSGPSEDVIKQLLGSKLANRARAQAWAKIHGETLIDDTPVGRFLDNFENVGTFAYFRLNPTVLPPDKNEQALKPWKQASRLFVSSLWGDVSTTVCGADRSRVYYDIELASALNPDHMGLSISELMQALTNPRQKPIEYTNEVPMRKIVQLYNPSNYEPAHRLVCLGEQRRALHDALRGTSRENIRETLRTAAKEVFRDPTAAYQYFLESKKRYGIDRAILLKGTPEGERPDYKKTPQERFNESEDQLRHFAALVSDCIRAELSFAPEAPRARVIIPVSGYSAPIR